MKKNQRNKVICFVLLMVMAANILVGCNGTGADSSKADTQEADTTQDTTVLADTQVVDANTESTVTATEEPTLNENVVSIKSFFEGITFNGQPWENWTFEAVCDACGLNEENGFWVGGDITLSDGYSIFVDKSMYESGIFENGEWIVDSKNVSFSTREELGLCETALRFAVDESNGEPTGIVSYVLSSDIEYGADGAELEWIEGYGKYMLDNNCKTLEDILSVLGMEEACPDLLETVRNRGTYQAVYVTEYGETEFRFEDGYRLTITFLEATSPYASACIEDWGDMVCIEVTNR